MNFTKLYCAGFGHDLATFSAVSDIAPVVRCTRCDYVHAVMVPTWLKPPPMPACKPSKPDVGSIQTVRLAAGDTLILEYPSILTPLQREKVRANVMTLIPDGCKVMVLDGGVRVAGTISAAVAAHEAWRPLPGEYD